MFSVFSSASCPLRSLYVSDWRITSEFLTPAHHQAPKKFDYLCSRNLHQRHLKPPSSNPSFICNTSSLASSEDVKATAQCLVAKEIWCDKRSKVEALVKSRISKIPSWMAQMGALTLAEAGNWSGVNFRMIFGSRFSSRSFLFLQISGIYNLYKFFLTWPAIWPCFALLWWLIMKKLTKWPWFWELSGYMTDICFGCRLSCR